MKFLFPFFLLITNLSFSQHDTVQRNMKTIIGELGKNGLVFNLHYDHYFFKSHFGFHAGGGTTIFNRRFELRTLTAGFYFLIGKKNEFYDLGFEFQYHYADRHEDDVRGFIFVDPPDTYEGVFPFLTAGYRRYSKKGVLRLGFAEGYIRKEFITGAYVGYGIILNRKPTK